MAEKKLTADEKRERDLKDWNERREARWNKSSRLQAERNQSKKK